MVNYFVVTDNNLCEAGFGTTKAENLIRALVLKADKVFGRDGWTLVKDNTLTGGYAREKKTGNCLYISPTPSN